MHVSSAVYRLLTLTYAVAEVATTLRTSNPEDVSMDPPGLGFARLVGNLSIPTYLLWRNIVTLLQRNPIIPDSVFGTSPWRIRLLLVFVWGLFALTVLVPLVAGIFAYSALGGTGSWVMTLSNASVYAIWFIFPTIFFVEILCALQARSIAPNNPVERWRPW
jgi:hypothetical protein